jgi:hypothetical protein
MEPEVLMSLRRNALFVPILSQINPVRTLSYGTRGSIVVEEVCYKEKGSRPDEVNESFQFM